MATDSNDIVKVVIVDDHRMFSDALNALLEPEPGINVLAQVFDSREAIEKIAEHDPHVVLMDYNMPHLNGIELTRLLLQERPETKVLIVSMYNEERLIKSFKQMGAKGYLFKTATAEEVVRATRTVHSGACYFPDENDIKSDGHESLLKELRLSDREMEVLQLMKAGLKTKEIAEELKISVYTAETHKNNIKLKVGLKGESDFLRFILGM